MNKGRKQNWTSPNRAVCIALADIASLVLLVTVIPRFYFQEVSAREADDRVMAENNCILFISNQSTDIDPVRIAVYIDNQRVVQQDFTCGDGHRFERIGFRLEQGSHTIRAVAENGRAEAAALTFDVSDDTLFWGIQYFYFEKDTDTEPYLQLSQLPGPPIIV